MAATVTPATLALDEAGVRYATHDYSVGYDAGAGYGEAVAAALGADPDRVFKTLVATVDDGPAVVIVPVVHRVALKALARALGGKRAELASPADAERLTGYVVGGISPFGQKRRLRAVLDDSALAFGTILVSGGRRGLEIEVAPEDLIRITGALATRVAD